MNKQPQTASHRRRNKEIYQPKGLIYRRRKPRQRVEPSNGSIEMLCAYSDINVKMKHKNEI